MSATYLRHFTRASLCLTRQAAIRPTNKLIHNAGTLPHLRHLTTTPFRAAIARVLPSRNSFAQVRFTKADIPPLSFWTFHVRPPVVPDGEASPAACFEACHRYAELAIEDAPGWRQRALSAAPTAAGDDGTIPLSTLHYAALLAMRSPATGGHLATHILHTGVMLNYAPSVLTMARLGFKADKLDKPQFAPAKDALGKLASSANDRDAYYRADALTLMGLVHARQGTYAGDDRALRFFNDAAQAARAPDAAWQWRVSAVLEQSRIYVRRKQIDLAREVLRTASHELDNAEACFEYAMLLPSDDPERTPMIERAAISGVEGAAREMGQIELQRAAERGLSSTERRQRRLIAEEWMGVAADVAII
ncbi:hypothetical protein F5Y13DRAFT_160741 [Hypoxylon sp. FL1857]|nr:hypothetical protein F5Y13DRAFT_160741 [Hypoxylon sp. FL1857]